MIIEEVKGIARSMITASHANQLSDKEFENYLNSIRKVVLKEVAVYLEDCKEYNGFAERNWLFIARLKAGILP